MVRVSVVMAFHRLDDLLWQAIDSILASDERDIEVLLVSDGIGSFDSGTARSRVTDNRVIFLEAKGNGAGIARNLGFANASGSYIAIMDSDDILLPYRISTQASFLDKNKQVVAVGSQVQYICPHGKIKGRSGYPRRVPRSFLFKPFDSMIANPTAMIRRSALEAIGGYREQFSATVEDLDMWNRLLRIGEIANLPHVLVQYRTHPLQNSSSNRTKIVSHARLSQLFDIHESFGDPSYFLRDGQTFEGAELNNLISPQARRLLTLRGKIRMTLFLLVIRAEEKIESARAQEQMLSEKLLPHLPFRARLKLFLLDPIALSVLFAQRKLFKRAPSSSPGDIACEVCRGTAEG